MALKRKGTMHGGSPRILVVTPEITYLPAGMGNMANQMSAKAGGLADVSASLVGALFAQGADVHVALPHYRRMFHVDVGQLIDNELRVYKARLPDTRIHLAEDRVFYYRDTVYSSYDEDNPKLALAFQREVINNILGQVRPDLVHLSPEPLVSQRLPAGGGKGLRPRGDVGAGIHEVADAPGRRSRIVRTRVGHRLSQTSVSGARADAPSEAPSMSRAMPAIVPAFSSCENGNRISNRSMAREAMRIA